jgi:hypothetical protein
MKLGVKSLESRVKKQTEDKKLRRWEVKKFQLLNSLSSQVLIFFFLLLTSYFSLSTSVGAAGWSGVDESVVEKYAEEHGRAAKEPFINTDQGDLLLFMFLAGGIIGGFAAGYYWRMLTEGRADNTERRREKLNADM